MKRTTIVDPFVPVRNRTTLSVAPKPTPPLIKSQAMTGQVAVKKRRLPRLRLPTVGQKWQAVIVTIAAAAAGLLMTVPGAGELVIAIYACLVIVLKIKSKITFILAGLMFMFVIALLLVEPSRILATAFATYAFLMLVIGLITLAIEARKTPARPVKPGLKLNKDE